MHALISFKFHFIAKCTLSVMLTGHVGTGKSAAGNFFIGKNVFASRRSFGGVTTESAAETAIVAQQSVQIIDTPGFMDAMLPEKLKVSVKEIAYALVLARNGVHAIGIVIDVSERLDKSRVQGIEDLLSSFKKTIVPYIFVLFTKAGCIQKNVITKNDEHVLRAEIEKMLADPTCPSQLLQLLQLTNYQYMTLETESYDKQSDYRESKCNELIAHINQIKEKNGEALILPAMNMAKAVYEKRCKQNEDCKENADTIEDTVGDVQSVLEKAVHKNVDNLQPGKMGSFWESTTEDIFEFTGIVAGGALGSYIGMPIVGAVAGKGAGKVVGKLVHNKFCKQQ